MTTTKFLLKPLFFIITLVFGAWLVLWIEKLKPSDFGSYKGVFLKEIIINKTDQVPLRKPSLTLTEEEREFAKIAWKYFQNNYHDSTGFVNGVQDHHNISLKDLTSYLMGMISAYEIGIISGEDFDMRISRFLNSLEKISLYKGKLPNKIYNPATLDMLDYRHRATKKGVGWSSLDIGRFFSFVNKVMIDYPQYQPQLKNAISEWNLNNMIIKGSLYGMTGLNNEKIPRVKQEGRLGYEEYCAKGLLMAGFDVTEAFSYTDFIKFIKVYKNEIGVDSREKKNSPAGNFILSEPYILDGMEYGWDVNSKELAYRVYNAQKERYLATGIVTSVCADYLDVPPYFIYNNVYADSEIWNCINERGDNLEHLKIISTKAAFGWYVLIDDEYAEILFDAVKNFYDPEKGWYAGQYEKTGRVNTAITASTNGIILEALNYKMNGKIINYN